MKPSLSLKLDQLTARLAELDHLLAAPESAADMDRFRALSRERAELGPVVASFVEYRKAEADVAAAGEMARDPDMREFGEEERRAGEARM
ncbi:MAG TPA: PCRF domain-containing protein, partial [Casimicrobiaceae bacterium]|nr:PCRF domain-containing protein [Casimicrobiaceae bacterium]